MLTTQHYTRNKPRKKEFDNFQKDTKSDIIKSLDVEIVHACVHNSNSCNFGISLLLKFIPKQANIKMKDRGKLKWLRV